MVRTALFIICSSFELHFELPGTPPNFLPSITLHKMISSVTSLLAAASVVAAANSPYPAFSGDPFQKYNLSAKGIQASFIPYGARLTSLCVNDRNGDWQDVAIGYDQGSQYLQDTLTNHTNFGSLVGRYANRYAIGNNSREPFS
jgi:aldose 1-epimerase